VSVNDLRHVSLLSGGEPRFQVGQCRLTHVESASISALKLKCDTLLSFFGFKLNLRRYIQAVLGEASKLSEAGADTRPHLSST
jgi:hypothetical protein